MAIKVEKKNKKLQFLQYEANLYAHFYKKGKGKVTGIPQGYMFRKEDKFNFLAMELLG